MVTTPQDVSLLDVRKGLAMFRKMNVPLLGIVENMAGFACPHCEHVTPIFGEGGVKSSARSSACRSSARFRWMSRYGSAGIVGPRSSSPGRTAAGAGPAGGRGSDRAPVDPADDEAPDHQLEWHTRRRPPGRFSM